MDLLDHHLAKFAADAPGIAKGGPPDPSPGKPFDLGGYSAQTLGGEVTRRHIPQGLRFDDLRDRSDTAVTKEIGSRVDSTTAVDAASTYWQHLRDLADHPPADFNEQVRRGEYVKALKAQAGIAAAGPGVGRPGNYGDVVPVRAAPASDVAAGKPGNFDTLETAPVAPTAPTALPTSAAPDTKMPATPGGLSPAMWAGLGVGGLGLGLGGYLLYDHLQRRKRRPRYD